jgi:hypothetical protein
MANTQDYIIAIKIKADGQAQAKKAMQQVEETVAKFGKTSLKGATSHNTITLYPRHV